MSGPGGQDAADRALDDALALANERRRPSAPGSPATPPDPHDPLSVALGHDEPPRPARPAERPREPGAAADPLAVALGLGREDTGSDPAAEPPGRPGRSPAQAEDGIPWPEARKAARLAGRRLPARTAELGEGALGMALARALVALTDLPSFDTSAMDGWAVAGNGPWRLRGRLMAGHRSAEPLHDGHAVDIATGAALPPGATSVLRSEHGRIERRTDGEWLRLRPDRRAPEPGQEVRRRGQECRGGDELLPAGTVVTAAVLGLASAAGYDELAVTTRPRVEVLVLGDELLDHGLPRAGRVRDALGPMLPSWLRALGAEVTSVRRLADDEGQLYEAVAGSTAELVITTGGTAGGPRDHVHPVLARAGARLLVDGVAVRPGHPMLLARLPSGGHLIGLPGNPLAAVAGALTLAAPLLRTLAGRPVPAPYAAPLTADVPGHPVDTRLVPVVFDDESAARPLDFAGPAMLRGLAAADGMAVIPPGGARAGDDTAVLDTGVLDSAWGSGG
ncbi:molybdopterin-binding protein [Streptomyces sp. CA-111067]|uniref:molybdopterin molybdotransferase MoeA n=1 Tax=Streptomyces sp. CA-111067 TaxID=3240046 RepID=UPI003D991377